jgi:hypothetical protein
MKNRATNTILYHAIKISWLNLTLLINIRRHQLKITIRNIGILKSNHLQIKKRKRGLNRINNLLLIQEVYQSKEIACISLHVRPNMQIIGRKTLLLFTSRAT